MSEVIEKAAELVDRAEINASGVLVEYSRTEAALAALRERYAGAKFDLTTTAGDKAARAARLDLVTLRTGLEKKRKELKAPAVEFGKKIDDEAKRITTEIVALEDPIDAQIKADEARREAERLERERIAAERAAGFRAKIEAIRACVTKAQGLTSGRISNGIAQVESIATDVATWAEFSEEAAQAKATTLAAMLSLRDAAKAREDEAARLEALRVENERIAAEQAAQAERMAAQQRALDEQAAAIAKQQKALDDAKAEEAAKLQRQQEAEAAERAAAELRASRARAEEEHARRQREEVRNTPPQTPQQVLKAEPATADATDRGASVITSPSVGSMGAGQPSDEGPATEVEEARTLSLGEIKAQIAPLSISAEGLEQLGFPSVKVKASCMYRPSDIAAMKAAMREVLA